MRISHPMRIFNSLLFATLVLSTGNYCHGAKKAISLGQGIMAGRVTEHSVILQSRLTRGRQLVDGDLPGSKGVARFEISRSRDFQKAHWSEWIEARPDYDHIVKAEIKDLESGTRYYYRLRFGPDKLKTRISRTGTFQTLGGRDSISETSFVAVTGMCYHFFHYGYYLRPDHQAYRGPDKHLGYPALEAILKMRPRLFIGTGDNVYYDHPNTYSMGEDGLEPPLGGWYDRAKTPSDLRRKYHEQFVQPRFIDLFAEIPTYWMKDDHDYRFNDSDPYMQGADFEGAQGAPRPSHELGVATFLEQLPVAGPKDPAPLSYGTYRINRLIQIWITENREFRSPNRMPDGPKKSLWGERQRDWLKETLLASDAPVKIMISSTAMVGPSNKKKIDNHTSGFVFERNAFFQWLKEKGLNRNHFYLICGDYHWPYHALDPSGVEEFCTGALVSANTVYPPSYQPGDPVSTDPDGKIIHLFGPKDPKGGFLYVSLKPEADQRTALLTFSYHDVSGNLLYAITRSVAF